MSIKEASPDRPSIPDKDYDGPKVFTIKVLYRKKSGLAQIVPLRKRRWLTVDLTTKRLWLHQNSNKDDHKTKNDIKFEDVQSVRAELSKESSNKFSSDLTANGSVYSFRFKDVHDFVTFVEAFRHFHRQGEASRMFVDNKEYDSFFNNYAESTHMNSTKKHYGPHTDHPSKPILKKTTTEEALREGA